MTDLELNYEPTTLETVDRAIRDWFDQTVNVRVKTPQTELYKVPVVFSSGERWSTGRTKQAFRDENGVLILPIISVRRVSVDNDPSKMALGVQTNSIQISRRIDPKTNQLQNLSAKSGRSYPPVYEVITVPFPDRLQATYQLVIQTQYITQMNDILQKIWRSLDIQKSFVAPFQNDGRQPPRLNQYGTGNPYEDPKPLSGAYVVGFMESGAGDSGNLEEFTDQERIVKYSTDIRVPVVLQPSLEGTPEPIKVERTAYKVVLKDENWHFVDDASELDKIFGK